MEENDISNKLVKIFVDDREDEKAIEALRKHFNVEIKRLLVGDVLYEEKGICIERKSVPDFFSSIRGHLQEQTLAMRDNYASRYIVVVGKMKDVRTGFTKVPQGAAVNMMLGAVASFTTKWGTPVLWVENNSSYAYLVSKICEKEGEPIAHDLVKRKISDDDRYLYMLMDSVEGMGIKKAKSLAEKFPMLTLIKQASDSQILEIDGIGKGMLENIRKAQLRW